MRAVRTGESGDPAKLYANAHQAKADALGEAVYRAKDTLLRLPRLTAPLDYVAARAVAEALQPNALLTTANSQQFLNAVATAEGLEP